MYFLLPRIITVIDLCIKVLLSNKAAVDTDHLLPSKKKKRAVGLDHFSTIKRSNGHTRKRENDEQYWRKGFYAISRTITQK